jgi:glutathione S-transferase
VEITLHQPPTRPWGTPNMSPFCAKLETYLRMAEIPYQPGKFARGDAPKGKVPYIRLDGELLGDSQLVIEELERRLAKAGKQPLDAGLSPRDAALARTIRRMIEEAGYFIGLRMRWDTEAGYAATRAEFKKFIPGFVVPIIRRELRKRLQGQGTGRHSIEEVHTMGAADWDAIATLLGDQPFMLGDKPRVVDCAVFGFLEGNLGFPVESPIQQRLKTHANLIAYRARIRERWWKDLPGL